MKTLRSMMASLSGALTLHSPALYRYPYRNSSEGLRADYKRVGDDIRYCLERYENDDQ